MKEGEGLGGWPCFTLRDKVFTWLLIVVAAAGKTGPWRLACSWRKSEYGRHGSRVVQKRPTLPGRRLGAISTQWSKERAVMLASFALTEMGFAWRQTTPFTGSGKRLIGAATVSNLESGPRRLACA